MGIVYLLVGVTVFMAFIFLILFIFSVKNGQFDEGESPSVRILYDNKSKENKK